MIRNNYNFSFLSSSGCYRPGPTGTTASFETTVSLSIRVLSGPMLSARRYQSAGIIVYPDQPKAVFCRGSGDGDCADTKTVRGRVRIKPKQNRVARIRYRLVRTRKSPPSRKCATGCTVSYRRHADHDLRPLWVFFVGYAERGDISPAIVPGVVLTGLLLRTRGAGGRKKIDTPSPFRARYCWTRTRAKTTVVAANKQKYTRHVVLNVLVVPRFTRICTCIAFFTRSS